MFLCCHRELLMVDPFSLIKFILHLCNFLHEDCCNLEPFLVCV
uniref:Uncharacterized protein n=1 Tax=Populus trichocarpa TaxID=3694 RepID=A0A3N7F379_POPTR